MNRVGSIKIGNRSIGPGYPSYIIFEVASTHSNDWELAKQYLKQAKSAGADAVKFQLFRADTLLNPISSVLLPTYNYFKTAETPKEWFPKLKKLCASEGIDLLCTPFDEDSAAFLNSLDLPAVKIGSGDLTHYQLLKQVAKFNKPIILSTGVSNMEEVRGAVEFLRKEGCNELAVLQCVSIYPMPFAAANVRVIKSYEDTFGVVTGYSDNGSEGILVPLVAISCGASIIEKHVTSQKERGNMDDLFSLSLRDFKLMVQRIRELENNYRDDLKQAQEKLEKEFGKNVELVLGNGLKQPSSEGIIRKGETVVMDEWRERILLRRGLYPKENIPKGTMITQDMLMSLRPDIGASAIDYDKVIGAKNSQDLERLQPIKINMDSTISALKKEDFMKRYSLPEEKLVAKELLDTLLIK